MVNILVVDRAQLRQLKRAFPRLLAKAPVSVWIHDDGCLQPEDQKAPRELQGAAVFFVGLRKRHWRNLLVTLDLLEVRIAKSVKRDKREIHEWLEALRIPIEEPFPTTPKGAPDFAAAVQRVTVASGHMLLASQALVRANRIAWSADHQATGFPKFVALSMSALARLSEAPLANSTLDLFFKRNAPGCVYAASGAETFAYLSPVTEHRVDTKKHLKPRGEKRGYHRAEHKPRIYFDIISPDDKGDNVIYVVILHVGPHPQTGATVKVSVPTVKGVG